jgi:hypothetical protein
VTSKELEVRSEEREVTREESKWRLGADGLASWNMQISPLGKGGKGRFLIRKWVHPENDFAVRLGGTVE